MWHWARRLFPPSSQPPAVPSKSADGLVIRRPERIAALLDTLRSRRVLLSAAIPGHKSLHHTLVLEVTLGKNEFLLDELHPHEGHGLLLREKTLQLKCRLSGADIKFLATLTEAASEDGVAYYRMRLPEEVYYHQRRRYHRVTLASNQVSFRGHWDPANRHRLDGYVQDLSLGGIRVITRGIYAIQAQQILPVCSLTLPDDEVLTCGIEVLTVTVNPVREVTLFGGNLINLDNMSQRRLSRFIRECERRDKQQLQFTSL
ncbi:flagellar brake protein [Gammaproteobacteria bacterium]